ncbi:MAG: matrixin family metalloprotease, partial [Planctomycetota bacterium]
MKICNTTATALTLVSLCGIAQAAHSDLIAWEHDQSIPASIASTDLLSQHEIAQILLPSLPADQRYAIESAGAFGSERSSCGHIPTPVEGRRGVIGLPQDPIDIHDPEFRSSMTAGQLAMLDAMEQSIEEGYTLPQTCFSPDVDQKFVVAVNELFQRSLSNGNARFQGNDRWTSTATDGPGILQGDPITLTYSYVPDGTFIPNIGIGTGSGTSVLFQWLNSRYGSPDVWQPLFDQVFDRWEELIGVTYVYEPNDDGVNTNQNIGVLGVRGDVRIGAFNLLNDSSNGGTLAYNNFPNDGDMIFDAFDSFYNNTAGNSRRLRNVIAHEHGHGLGMLHVCPINQTKLMEPTASTAFDGPQLDDILGGQRRYGDNFEPQSNDPSNPPFLGTVGVNGFAILENVSIDDNSDFDFYKFTLSSPGQVQISVAPSAGSYFQGPQNGNGSCSSGTLTDYNARHDLSIFLLEGDSPFAPVLSVNDAPAGETENLITNVFTPGDYLIQISGDSTNGIQRYLLTLFIGSVGQCSDADIAAPFGTLNFFDISAYIGLYNDGDAAADLAAPFGTLNFFD